jgi:hypothetical protein
VLLVTVSRDGLLPVATNVTSHTALPATSGCISWHRLIMTTHSVACRTPRKQHCVAPWLSNHTLAATVFGPPRTCALALTRHMLPLAPCVVMMSRALGSLLATSTNASPMVPSPVHSCRHGCTNSSKHGWGGGQCCDNRIVRALNKGLSGHTIALVRRHHSACLYVSRPLNCLLKHHSEQLGQALTCGKCAEVTT